MCDLTNKQVIELLRRADLNDISYISSMKSIDWSKVRNPKTNDTIFHTICRRGYYDLLKLLLQSTPSGVRFCNNDGKTALHEAAQFGHSQLVAFLLAAGADVNALRRGDWTPLMLACTTPSIDTITILLDNKANIDVKNKDGWTALHLAVRIGVTSIVDLLIKNGANPLALTSNGRNILHIASLHGHLSLVEFLLLPPLDKQLIEMTDKCGNTALCDAVTGGSTDICCKLIENGANYSVTNNGGFTLLHLATKPEMLDYLLKLDLHINTQSKDGFTPLHCAAKRSTQLYQHLKNYGASNDIYDQQNRLASDYLTPSIITHQPITKWT